MINTTYVLATHNPHKIAEFQQMLGARDAGVSIIGYDGPEPIEDGTTFAENALIKARTAAQHTGLPALADDSGLCVDVLNGAPGIFSARWAGSDSDDEKNLTLLLDQLSDVPAPHRGAHYVCVIAVVIPESAGNPPCETVVEGRWFGSLQSTPQGGHGFGYDPIFVPTGGSRTAAQMEPQEKNAQSHRARALEELHKVLGDFS